MTLPYLDAGALAAALPMAAAIDALEAALVGGLDPAADPPRTGLTLGNRPGAGQLLVMPSAAGGGIAVKLVTVADAPAPGRPRIQGVVVVFDQVTLSPVAVIDGAALTILRTPAVSGLAVRHAAPAGAHRLVVIGSGPQAEGHVTAMRAVRPIDEVVIVGRDPGRAAALAERCAEPGLSVRTGTPDDVARADLVVCATTARQPLFDSRRLRPGACVVAVGSHEPDAREVDSALVLGSRIVVEDVATAMREAGDLILAGVDPGRLESLGDVVRRHRTVSGEEHVGRVLIKTVGMAWQDSVVAAAAVSAGAGRPPGSGGRAVGPG